MKTSQKIGICVALAATILVISCKKNNGTLSGENRSDTPTLPETPYNYVASSNDALASLGRVLFYDKNLSLNNSVSCSSCHQQNKAFCDNLKFSVGLEDVSTARNSPSIFAKTGRMFWDGRAGSMKDLVMRPIKNHVEMKFDDLASLATKIANINYYPDLFKKAFGTSKIDSSRIQSALSEFLGNFNFSDNKFARSQANKESLTATEEIGKNIFFDKGKCFNCHHIDQRIVNVPFPDDSLGNNPGYGFTDMSFNIGLDLVYADKGLGALPGMDRQEGEFMVPALLNVEYTAPYMHDGRFKTLEEVVEHYNSGIKNHPNLSGVLRDFEPYQNMSEQEILNLFDTNHDGDVDNNEASAIPPVRLGLTDNEKRCLVAFLKTLSDPKIFSDQRFSNPFMLK